MALGIGRRNGVEPPASCVLRGYIHTRYRSGILHLDEEGGNHIYFQSVPV